jgi:hypothetical protein
MHWRARSVTCVHHFGFGPHGAARPQLATRQLARRLRGRGAPQQTRVHILAIYTGVQQATRARAMR